MTMLPPPKDLPGVLPTDRLLANGKAVPQLRADLRHIAGFRNAVTICMVWAQIVAILAVAVWIANPFAWLAVLIVFGAYHARVAILGHEAAHRLLFANKSLNDSSASGCCRIPASCRSTCTGARTSRTTRRSSGRTSPTSTSTTA